MNPIPTHPTWSIYDSSKIQAYMRCPRRFFYEYCLGWRPEGAAQDAYFGVCFHEAMDIMITEFGKAGSYTAEAVNKAFQRFEELYRQQFPEVTDELYDPKTPALAHIALAEYAAIYARDSFKVIANETSGQALIGTNLDGTPRLITYRIDSVVEDDRGIWGKEHKTTKWMSDAWKAKWHLSLQVGTYTHGLYCNFNQSDVRGIIVNVFNFKKVPKRKPSVERLTIHDYDRIFVEKNPEQIGVWLSNVNYWIDRMQTDYQVLEVASDEEPTMEAFQMNTNACTDFNRKCPYFDFCQFWANPIQHLQIENDIVVPELGFKTYWWNPQQTEDD